ncbi:hypothetical protein [Amycolatopsis thailandensis]|uniref:hypothetical protein n=1 Tax=Amycolatopsis thailandensis TaxID=589330 RepID=UPI0011789D14|nr:hypothetical protein [Amycolatopsis thailandensis]
MTVAIDTRAGTNVELLYLTVDLGERPLLNTVSANAAALSTLAAYASNLTSSALPERWSHESGLRIVRTSLASPWVTVISDLAANSRPLGYGVAGLYGLHRLLQIVMNWQNHRADLAERHLHLEALRDAMLRESVLKRPESFGSESRSTGEQSAVSFTHAGPVTGEPEPGQPYDSQADEAQQHLDSATAAGQELGQITAVEMIAPDDPRATGT